ncbi:hypothetical protein ACFL0S_00620 [Thermodesulfobacteriota bacterium]
MTKRPTAKKFDSSKYKETIASLESNMSELEFERLAEVVVPDILENYEKFTGVLKGPNIKGTPFDFLGYKGGKAYIIEFKGSLRNFNSPGETQKRRLQEILDRVDGLGIALLQVKLEKSLYRIFYDQEMELLFEGKLAPIEPVVEWVKKQL